MYSVNTWDGPPGTDNCCNSGIDFASLAAAKECYRNPADFFAEVVRGTWIELVGPDVEVMRRDMPETEAEDDVSGWIKEISMQCGMGFGVGAYNEAMGYV